MAKVDNQLIKLLPRGDRQKLFSASDTFELILNEVLSEPGDKTRFAYFPNAGFVSLVMPMEDRAGLEVGMVGREGMVGVHAALGVAVAPLRAIVQGQGFALRIPAEALRAQLGDSPELRRVLHRYVHVLMTQLATSAACLRHHQIGPRLARWLLMTQDRACSDHFRVTQELLAYLLGVRRVGITAAAGALQHDGLIRYARGHLTVLDRSGLEKISCYCYASDRRGYSEILG
ncbi:Crp/Fnr family transcriptional regulator [Variovorax sp. GT1P44]|uniref:Crp/Fnr family transcriptional regulator n=1 Tax=Variovorax sp. GT1P44 TaxID=3443742 RepID=UPI003F47A1CF